MLIDTHAHLSYKDDIKEILKNAKENNVGLIILGGTNIKENNETINIINENNDIYAVLGYHPECASFIEEKDYDLLSDLIDSNNKVIGIGEIGLDYHYETENRDRQIDMFNKQLQMAEKKKLPVVIHTRDAIQETYDILSKYKLTGIIHCYSGSYEMAQKFINLGYFLGIGGVISFSNSHLKDVVEKIDLEHIVLETDSPYLSPIRGDKNESKNIKIICKKIAEIKNMDEKKVEEITTSNAIQIFDLYDKI